MTYFGFLLLFLGAPLAILLVLTWRDARRWPGRSRPNQVGRSPGFPARLLLALHVLAALIWTTPWDNYLVATGVWWYDPALVTGLTLGWVPVEEYFFFILQPLLTGLWLLFWARRLPRDAATARPRAVRRAAVLGLGGLWAIMAGVWLSGWEPGTYLSLQLIWALPPLMLQAGFGADLLWQNRRLFLIGLVPPTLYLAAADAVAIGAGTWTIDPAQSLGWLLGGRLPFEEFLFFGLTNLLVVAGMTLGLAPAGAERAAAWLRRLRPGPGAATEAPPPLPPTGP